MEPEGSLLCSQEPVSILRPCVIFCDNLMFYDQEFSVPYLTPKMEDDFLLDVCNCSFNIFLKLQ